MRRTLREIRVALPLAVLLATVAFALSFATGETSADVWQSRGVTVKPRDVIQPIRFTNPFLIAGTDFDFPNGGDVTEDPDGFDLGDAAEGKPLTRVLSAYGGHQPHTFALRPLLGSSIASPGKGAPTLPDLAIDGLLKTPALDTGLGAFLRFNAELGDFIGSGRIGTFRLSLVNLQADVHQFAVDRLPMGVRGNFYYTTLDTLGGNTVNGQVPVVYSLVAGSVKVGTAAVNSLEDIGLTLASDGRVFGRPIAPGVVTFTVEAKDASGRKARSRDGTSQTSQTVSLTVEVGTAVVTEMAAQSVSIKGNRALDGFDSLSYTGVFDSRGFTGPALAGSPVTLRIGSATFVGTFDDRGNATFTNAADDAKVSIKISSAGRLSMKVSNGVIGSKIGILPELNGTSNRGVVFALETKGFRTTEVLNMETKALPSGRFSMTYALGKKGFSLAGAFQILKVDGNATRKDGERTTSWQVRFLGVPGQDQVSSDGKPTAGKTIGDLTTCTLRIGSDFSQELALTTKNPDRAKSNVPVVFKATRNDAGVRQLTLDPKSFKHFLQTNPLSPGETGIPAAIDTKNLTVFPLGLTVNGLGGETGRIIAPNREKWSQR